MNNSRDIILIDWYYLQCYTAKASIIEYNHTSANITGRRHQALDVLRLRCTSQAGQQ